MIRITSSDEPWLRRLLRVADDGSDVVLKFVETLAALPDADVPHAIVRFAFEYFENLYMSPAWWYSLAAADQSALMKNVSEGVKFLEERDPKELLDDGVSSVGWTFGHRHTNLPNV